MPYVLNFSSYGIAYGDVVNGETTKWALPASGSARVGVGDVNTRQQYISPVALNNNFLFYVRTREPPYVSRHSASVTGFGFHELVWP